MMRKTSGRRVGIVLSATIVALSALFASTPVSAQAPPAPPGTAAKAPEGPLPANPFPRRIKAPPLEGAVAWLNVAAPLEVEQLKGKFVILDFWTYCCINCMHILPELKKLERAYPNELVVIGVHSAKFDEEKDAKNIQEAILRYEIEHPVANDAEHAIWNRYGVSSWPTLLMIDPEGYVVFANSGETTFDQIDPLMKKAIAYYKAKGTLDETPIRFDLEAHKAKQTPLRFPGKVLADGAGKRLFIADSNHNRIVVSSFEGKLLDVIGDGTIGRKDGDYATASFDHPQGMALHREGDQETLYVCDTENHLLRKVDLTKKTVKTIAGTGIQARGPWPGMSLLDFRTGNMPKRFVAKPLVTALNSPWDLAIHGKDLYIAMAGPHQIWKMPLSETEIGPFAGNGREDIVDGDLLPPAPYAEGYSSFAQPSGLASDGQGMFVADSEGASIRWVPFDPAKQVVTIIGTSKLPQGRLFFFGDKDGVGDEVRLQHPLGVAYDSETVYVADTYNNKIKAITVKTSATRTLAGNGKPGAADEPAQFDEPAGISFADGKLFVADTNNHAIRVVDLKNGNKTTTLAVAGLEPPKKQATPPEPAGHGTKLIGVERQTLKAASGAVRIGVKIKLPEGWKMNPLAPMRYSVSLPDPGAVGPVDKAKVGSPVRIDPPAAAFEAVVPLTAATGEAKIRLALTYYYCKEGKEGVCKVGSAEWSIPLTVADDGKPAAALEIAPE